MNATPRSAVLACLFAAAVVGLYSFWRGAPLDDGPIGATSRVAVTVTDLAGRRVVLRRPADRIVLLRSYCFYELAAVLGDEVDERLVGWDSTLKNGDRDAFDTFVARMPQLAETVIPGDALRGTVNAEAVLALNPDLVITDHYLHRGRATIVRQLERAGVPILCLDYRDPLRDPQRSIRLLGRVLGKEERAEAIAQWIDAELDEVFSRLDNITGPRPSIYVEAGTHGPDAYGNTFGRNEKQNSVNWGALLDQLRCRNVASGTVSGSYGMGVIRPEYLLTADPEVIVITGANWNAFPESLRLGYHAKPAAARNVLAAFTARPGWESLPAVQAGRIHGIHTRFGGGHMSFVAAQQLAKWLYPDEFRELDPRASLREFHQRFLPIELSGTWVVSLEGDR